MNMKMILLNVYLNELGVQLDIGSKAKRIVLQKVVYLGQASGADLGYRYSWYLNGPYSTDLTRDYYKLVEDSEAQAEAPKYDLAEELSRPLESIKPLLAKPKGFHGGNDEWLELIASLDYAMRVLLKTPDGAAAFVSAEKQHLAQYVPMGIDALKQSSLGLASA